MYHMSPLKIGLRKEGSQAQLIIDAHLVSTQSTTVFQHSDPCVHTDSRVKLLEKSVSFDQNNKSELPQGALIWSSFQREVRG